MRDETTVTMDQLKQLVKDEKIRPEDIFSEEALKALTDKARGEGYAEAVIRHAKPAEKKPDKSGEPEKDKGGNDDRYTSPAKNPFIKTD